MATNIRQCVDLLKKVHLFHGLSEERLTTLAEKMGELSYAEAQELYAPGDKADAMFLVLRGGVKVSRKTTRKAALQPDHFTEGDYFGLEPAFKRPRRIAKASVDANTTLLVIQGAEILELIKESPHFKTTLQLVETSRRNIARLFFRWLQPDETIYLLLRKHYIVLYQMLLGPMFALMVPFFFLFLWALTPNSAFPPVALAMTGFLDALWFIWVVIDYGNDYYIITNRRIIWVEKIIGLYDSRQESPISQMQSASVETGFLGRILDYGDVVSRTFTSRITFSNIEHPHQVQAMLDEYLNRSKIFQQREEVEAMKQAIRIKLKLAEPPNPPAPPAAAPPGGKINIPRLLIRELFKLRAEESGKIVYRKHWYILIRQVGMVTAMLFLDLIGLFYFGILSQIANRGTVVVLLFTAFFPLALWWIYQFADWRNDRFELTSEQIMDIDKKPLGTEQRKTAKLEDILSIEFERIGLLGYLLNFGTVYIKVGTTDFTFDEVHDPASVQAEIEEWRNRRLINKRNAESAAERERMANWIAAYHNNRGEFLPPEN